MMLYLKTVWYLYRMVLRELKFKSQPLVLKPFCTAFALWCCVLGAITIRVAVAKMPIVGGCWNEN